jgi:hypothetical protein
LFTPSAVTGAAEEVGKTGPEKYWKVYDHDFEVAVLAVSVMLPVPKETLVCVQGFVTVAPMALGRFAKQSKAAAVDACEAMPRPTALKMYRIDFFIRLLLFFLLFPSSTPADAA